MITTNFSKVVWVLLSTVLFNSYFLIGQSTPNNGASVKELNFEEFNKRVPKNLDSWREHNDPAFFQHPDFGILDNNAPCQNCVEVLSKREVDLKYYIDISDPSRYYVQRANQPLHRMVNGDLVSIQHKLNKLQDGKFRSPYYLNPIEIDATNKTVTISDGTQEIYFNNWSLYKRINENEELIGNANWSNFTAGDDGVYVTNIFPGVDAELLIYPGKVKTNFILNQVSFGTYDALVFKDMIDVTSGNLSLKFKHESSSLKGVGTIEIKNDGRNIAEYGEAIAYPLHGEKNMARNLIYEISDNSINMVVPSEWIEKYKNQYTLIIDPPVQGSNTLAQASITGSEYNATCGFDNSCDQFLTVPAPANATFDDVIVDFTYNATGICWLEDGATRFATNGCVNPSAPGFYWFCPNAQPGTCALTGVSLFSDLQACLPSPSCSPQNVPFTMEFFRSCWGSTGCNNTCIGAETAWTMTITGQTIDYTNISNPITVSSNTVCEGESINVSTTAQNGVPTYTYNWSFDPSGTPSVGSGASTSITFPNSGTVTLYSIVTDNCGQESTASEVITVNPSPTPTISGDTEHCEGQTASISTGAFSSYSWSNGANTQNTTVTTADNPITVTVTDANGCSGTSAQYNVTENPNPTPTITGSSTYCAGNTAAISTQAGFSNYSWSNGAGTQNTNVTDADNPITVTVTDANGCTGTSAQFNVSEQANITYSETVEICQGQSATIHGNTETTAGTYQQTFTTATCDSIATITLVVNPLPTITASATIGTICAGESTDLSAAGGDTYSWDNGLGAGSGHTVNPGTSTTYTVTGTDANGCENTDQVTITVNPLPTVDAGGDVSVCDGDDVTLSGSGTATTYSWDNGITDGTAFTPPAGTTTYTLTGTDANGCENTDQVDVTVNPNPTVNAGLDTTICEGESLTLSGSGTATTYTWDNGVTDGTPFTPGTGTITYTVTGTDANGCSATDQVDVNTIPQPVSDFSATPMSGAPPLAVDFSNQSSNGTSYDWDFGNGSTASNPSNTDESETYNATGTYEVILVVSNGDCADQSSLLIVVEESPLNYVIPNGFTPNDDGTNDIFHMNISNAESVEIEIFNRWGNMVGKITSLDPSNGWDGNDFSGNPVTDGVYFYTYKIIDLQGEEHTGHQYLHLERNN